jgi:F-type H+-transporting ATPase subunit epsilon
MADLPTSIHLTVVTRERKVLEAECDEVVLPGVDGYLGILPGHTPLLAMLRIGVLTYRSAAAEQRMVLSWGFAEVLPNRVIVLAENAYLPDEIDASAADRQRLDAERELATIASHDADFAAVEAKLQESIARANVAHSQR